MVHYPLVRNLKPALVWLVAYALLVFASLLIPPMFFAICFLSPILLTICGIRCGLAPLGVCALLLPAAAWQLFGASLAPVLCAIYLWPFLIVHVVCFMRKIPFWKSAAVHVAALAVSQTVILIILRPYLGGDLFGGSANFLVQKISESSYSDQILLQLYQTGLLSLPKDMAILSDSLSSFFNMNIMLPGARTELLNGLRTVLQSSMYSFLPSTVINSSILAGVFGVAFPILAAKKRNIPTVKMDPFSKWHLSRSTGFKVFLLGFGNVLPTFFPSPPMLLAGNMMWASFFTIFVIQGAALMDFFRMRSVRRPPFRWLWPCAIYVLMPVLLMIMGIADQFMNIRGLRKPKDREDA